MEDETRPLSESFHNLKWINWVCLGMNTDNGKDEPLFTTEKQVKKALNEFRDGFTKRLSLNALEFNVLNNELKKYFGDLVE